jgi:hypothetical protein
MVSGWNRSLAEDPHGLAGDAGDLELTFQLVAGWGRRTAGDLELTFYLGAGWGRRMEQESG